ncbi:hypothetical protein M409DRAFT_64005 [Zasmidium cellare ATCC 36951]|uniref:ubiquitinyl hydrolase 1 n=1 Tax=Zasmidium cellare ATCC 36951 TaxID=1080233 RepID=A0A6A6CVF4_ZASCE|nr:uncharacterized protein M409DRAFT_64005 [Zasmidium cellare ATCC 36951]KAF2171015.1 hypothetical protein M409DRAFT_64005 [Zasmidium cellare ATCC 36951]
MSGVHRFLSRRDKKNPRHSSPGKHRPDHFGGVFAIEDGPNVKPDKDEERKIQGILERLRAYGIDTMVEANARYALRLTSSQGDGEAAFRLLMLLQETYEGIVKSYSPNTKLLGAVNRESVTCYLDALLFAMFARLDSFEAMLYDSFEDVPRKKLAGLLRLWVNMLRSGRLITVDITRHLQEALAACGWDDAVKLQQQDPSEAFTFITGKLELPLLTLKMDLYHTGKEDPQDDHKFVNERLLEVAIAEQPSDGSNVITLEDCLEHYFNNRIEVKRHLENQRRNTLKSANLNVLENPTKIEKETGIHVEVAEMTDPDTPIVQTPVSDTPATPSQSKDPLERIRPTSGRKRGDSIFSQRKVELIEGRDPEKWKPDGPNAPPGSDLPTKERKLSTRTEVLMPAWQFFKLLPWYTDHMPTSDAQVAAHFSKKRPVLGICLKRYSYTNTGQAQRLNTYIDIPLEIAVPNFVSDEHMQDEGPLVGNFRLLLQSVVCHRGVSVHSGHYVCLSRGSALNATDSRRGSDDSDEIEDPWMRFDDLAKDRITYVDIREALKQETPYLLFYQVQPIGDDGHSIHDLPSYAEATSRAQSDVNPSEKPYLNEPPGSENALEQVPSSTAPSTNGGIGSETADWAPRHVSASARTSLDVARALDGPRGRSSFQGDERRRSLAFDNSSVAGSVSGGSLRTDATVSIPSTPNEEKPDEKATGFLAVANKLSNSSRRGSRQSKGSTSKSRPPSTGPDSGSTRFSLNMSKLTQKMSRGESQAPSAPAVQSTDPSGATLTVTEIPPADNESSARTESRPASRKPSLSHPLPASLEPSTRENRESVDTARPSKEEYAPLTKKEKEAVKRAKKKARKGEDDRECVVM